MEYLWHWLEIQRMFSEKTRAAFAERARLANDNEAAASLSDFKTHFTRSIRSSSWSDVGFKFGGMADPIVRGSVKADRFIRDLAKFLRESPPFILPYLHSSPPLTPETAIGDTRRLVQVVNEHGNNEWGLHEMEGTSNVWDGELSARFHVPVTIYRLQNKYSGSQCHFCVTDTDRAHILLFKVDPRNESRFWVARRDFKACFEIFVKAGFQKATATVLTVTSEYPVSPSVKEWRNDEVEINGQPMRKLVLFWRRLGAVPVREAKNVTDGVFFAAPSLALEVKQTFEREGLGNPYALLSHSIYEKGLERELAGNTPFSFGAATVTG